MNVHYEIAKMDACNAAGATDIHTKWRQMWTISYIREFNKLENYKRNLIFMLLLYPNKLL